MVDTPPLPPFEIVQNATLTPLTGGVVSQVYKCKSKEATFVWRQVPIGTNWDVEQIIAKQAGERGLSPKVILTDKKSRSFLLEFIPAQVLLPFSPVHLGTYKATISLLKQFHQSGIDVAEKSTPFTYIDRLEKALANKNIPLPPLYEKAQGKLQKLRQRFSSPPLVICHNDFHRKNVLVDKDGRPYLIDFSCAKMGDPTFDLAKFLLFVDEPYKTALLMHYYQGSLTQDQKNHFDDTTKLLYYIIFLNRYLKTKGAVPTTFSLVDLDIFPENNDTDLFMQGALTALHFFLT